MMCIKERYIDSKGVFMKRRLIVVFIACTVLLTPIFSFADSEGTETINSINTNISSASNAVNSIVENSDRTIQPKQLGGFYYRKKVKRVYTAYSSYRKVSDSIHFPERGGSITVSRQVTIHGSISGSIFGINVSTGGSVSSFVGYTLNGTPGKTQHIGFRAKYRVKEGVRYKYNQLTGRLVSSNTYKVMKPVNGEYALLLG